mmetsp:Transcript_33191/g.49159  ORF Transcript_33191/g.49159 Transcript_33191/m.49159 type:complete len:303 (-) Transcript_33191:1196-2104(-)
MHPTGDGSVVLGFLNKRVRSSSILDSPRVDTSSVADRPVRTVPSSRVSISTYIPTGICPAMGDPSLNLVAMGGVPLKTTPSFPGGKTHSLESGILLNSTSASGFLRTSSRSSESAVAVSVATNSLAVISMYVVDPMVSVSTAIPARTSRLRGLLLLTCVTLHGGPPLKTTPSFPAGRRTVCSSGRGKSFGEVNSIVAGLMNRMTRPSEDLCSPNTSTSSCVSISYKISPFSKVRVSTDMPIIAFPISGDSGFILVTDGGVPRKTIPSLPGGRGTTRSSGRGTGMFFNVRNRPLFPEDSSRAS